MNPLMSAFEDRDSEMYMDNAATTAMSEEVIAEMTPYLEERYGNPETQYHLGREAKEAVEVARVRVSRLVGCKPEEVFFTSGGTEANNWALKGFKYSQNYSDPKGLVVGSVEHESILRPAEWVTSREICSCMGWIEVNANGVVDMDVLKDCIGKSAGLVSVQYANNETGAIQPVKEIAEACKELGARYHCDAVQAAGKIPIDMDDDGIDMLTLSAHKLHGPMGVGALCIREGIPMDPLMHGGPHQDGRRAGTIPVPQVVGFGKAAEMAFSWRREMERIRKVRNKMVLTLKERMDAIVYGGDNVLPTIISFTVPGVEASAVCGVLCERYGVCISTGAACSRGADSHVLSAMGVGKEHRRSSFRISLSVTNTEVEGVIAVDRIQAAIREAGKREMI